MVSLTIDLEDSVADSLRQMAREQERSESDLIRDAIACYVLKKTAARPKGIGAYHSGRSDVSENARAIIRQAVENQQWP